MELKPGSRWKSAVCTAEVIVVRPPNAPVILECGGQAMIGLGDTAPEGMTLVEADGLGTTIGKRYQDPHRGIEVLGSRAGKGSLSIDGAPLALKDAKPLPASD